MTVQMGPSQINAVFDTVLLYCQYRNKKAKARLKLNDERKKHVAQ